MPGHGDPAAGDGGGVEVGGKRTLTGPHSKPLGSLGGFFLFGMVSKSRIYNATFLWSRVRLAEIGVWLGKGGVCIEELVANKDHQGWHLARSLDITLGHPIPPFLYPSLG
jgi:hypothetical protein